MTRRAVLIGCNGVPETGSVLHEAENDTVRLSTWLQLDDAWRSRDSITLVKPNIQSRELRKKISTAISHLQDRKDFGLIYFSGHGVIHDSVPSIQLQNSWLSFQDVVETCLNNPSEANIVLVIDCCYPTDDPSDRSGIQRMTDAVTTIFHGITTPQLPPIRGKRTLLFACSVGQHAFESSALDGGFFTTAFMLGCEGEGDYAEDLRHNIRNVTIEKIRHFAVKLLQGLQNPLFLSNDGTIQVKFIEEQDGSLPEAHDAESYMFTSTRKNPINIPSESVTYKSRELWSYTASQGSLIYSFTMMLPIQNNDDFVDILFALGTKTSLELHKIHIANGYTHVTKIKDCNVDDGIYQVAVSANPPNRLFFQHGMNGVLDFMSIDPSENAIVNIGEYSKFIVPFYDTRVVTVDASNILRINSLKDADGNIYLPLEKSAVQLICSSKHYIYALLATGELAIIGPMNKKMNKDIHHQLLPITSSGKPFFTNILASPNEQHLIFTGTENNQGCIYYYDLGNASFNKLNEYISIIRAVAYSPDNRWFANCTDYAVHLFQIDERETYQFKMSYDIRENNEIELLPSEKIMQTAISSQLYYPMLIALGTDHGRIFLWDIEKNTVTVVSKMGDEIIFSLSFIHVNIVTTLLAAASASKITIWQISPVNKPAG